MAIAVDFSNVEDKEYKTLVAGNYVGTFVNVKNVPLECSKEEKDALDALKGNKVAYINELKRLEELYKGNYLNIDFEISEGPLVGYAGELNEKFGFWPLSFSISYKQKSMWKFKNFIKSIEDYDYNANVKGGEWDEHSIEGCDFGISIQIEHYIGKDDKEKTRLKRWGNHVFGTPEKARKNELKAVEDAFTEEANTLNNATSWLAAEADNPFA